MTEQLVQTGYLTDDRGNRSSTRLVKTVWGIGIFFVWAVVSTIDGKMADIPDSIIWILGIVLGGSAIQKAIEMLPNLKGGS